MHQDHNGNTKHMIDGSQKFLVHEHGQAAADKIMGKINQNLVEMRSCHEAFYPSQGLDAPLMHAEERKGIIKFLAVAMYGLVPDSVAELFAEYARWQQLRDYPNHTDTSLEFLAELTTRLQKRILDNFGHVKDWAFVKFINMRKYADHIKEWGMIALSDTGPKEAFIKRLRKAWDCTNKKLTSINKHVAQQFLQQEAAAVGLASLETADAADENQQEATGARQRAQQSGQPAMSKRGKLFRFADMTEDNSWSPNQHT